MSLSYRRDAVLARASGLQAGVERANEILERAGLGRPLGTPSSGPLDLLEVPLTRADPVAVRDALRDARGRGEDVPEFLPDPLYAADTVEDVVLERDFVADGKKLGHGVAAWLPVSPDRLPQAPPWPPSGTSPVVALLDTTVRAHTWLPGPSDGPPPFLTVAGWQPSAASAPGAQLSADGGEPFHLGSHWGHGTFIAGLIRLAAPAARLLSVPVMDVDGRVSESAVVDALDWLANRSDTRPDVVLMAFGRPRDDADERSELFVGLKAAIKTLADQGVKIVASAGNDGGTRPTVPACFADEPNAPLVSVGAGCSEADPAWFSNRGSWVKAWRPGSDVLSIMPLRPYLGSLDYPHWGTSALAPFVLAAGNGAARWSGSSFAAAGLAGELARTVKARQPSAVGP